MADLRFRNLDKLKPLILNIIYGRGPLSIRKIEGHIFASEEFDEYKWEERYDHFDIIDSLRLLKQEGHIVHEGYHWRIK